MPVKLRDHQVEAVDGILRGLDIPAGGIPEHGLRAQVHAACGTGKTMIAAAAARRMVPHGRVLVVVPTLDLLTQTVRAWRGAGHTGPAVAVCSLQDDPELHAMDVRCTTIPTQLALWHGTGPVTAYATYASLGVLGEAFAGTYGQRLGRFDLVVVDEAHRTSGSLGKAWADIHHDHVVPADRRLYLTATPRIWQERPPAWQLRANIRAAARSIGPAGNDGETARELVQSVVRERLREEMAASMDDGRIFGPVVYRLTLADAVARGLLARYQIIVVELQDPEVTPERLRGQDRHEEEVRGLRLGALQAAMLRTMAEHGLQSMITFHHRTIEAQAFAEGLGSVAARLHATDPGAHPARVWSGWLHGEHTSDHRRDVIADFGSQPGRAVLSNCKVLGEGVDIRAVDSVALLDPKGAPHDIVQAIGRALRQTPGQGKLASLVVPVFLAPGESEEDMFTSGSYRPLINVLQALRAHDEEAVELLAIPQNDDTRSTGATEGIGPAPAEGEEENRLLLRFASPRDPAMIADWVAFNVIDTERQDWARGYAAARRYRRREGHLRVPFDHTEAPATEGGRPYPLGHWIGRQRQAYTAGTLSPNQIERLERLGMVWDLDDLSFQEHLAAARAYYAEHGTLAAPRSATALDRPVGQWLTNQRRPAARERHPEWADAIAQVDPDWNPAWPLDWQRHYAYLAQLLTGGAPLAEITPGVTRHGHNIGRWLAKQSDPQVWAELTGAQRERLGKLGVTPAPAPETAPEEAQNGAVQPATAFDRGVAALRQYHARTGSLTVPRGHTEPIEGVETPVRLGVWLSNTKARRSKLTAEQLEQLAVIGLDWR